LFGVILAAADVLGTGLLEMSAFTTRPVLILGASFYFAELLSVAAFAQDRGALRTDLPPALAERLVKERQARAACNKLICGVARSKKAEGDPISCKVVKTWPAQDLTDKILNGKMVWKWGHVQCEIEEKLDRALLVKAMTEPKVEINFGKRHVACKLEQEDGKGTHHISFTVDPTVTFENGKAVKAVYGWSEVTGDPFAKSAFQSVTIVDHAFNILQNSLVHGVNEFFGPECDDALK
jgi:hypothetical protein